MKIGITIGDVNGISAEVILKALEDSRILERITPVIYGTYKVISYHKNIIKSNLSFHSVDSAKMALSGKNNIVTCWNENVNITLGKATFDGGKYAKISLDRALEDLKAGEIDALVTAPINKNAMKQVNFDYGGHTEFLTAIDDKKESLMLMISDDLKIALVTNHLPLSKVSSTLSKELIINKIKILHKALVEDFGYERPLISVLGLNPHASDDSVIGDEEEKIIRPAIVEAKKQGIMVVGPYAADGFFGSDSWKKTDAILAMYHDQGLIPFKALSFGSGTNVTCGLSFIRTSPDHGTAYDIAGQNIADGTSMRNAIFRAAALVRMRKEYFESRENKLVVREKRSAHINE